MPKWVQLEPNQIRYLNQQVEAIKAARDWRDRDLAQAFGVNLKAVQNYAGRQPTPRRIKASTLKRIAGYAEKPEEFAEVLGLTDDNEESEEEDAIAELRQTISEMQCRISALECKVCQLEAQEMVPAPEPSTFSKLVQAHMQAMRESITDVARATRIPVDRLQEFLSSPRESVAESIDTCELSALGIWYGSIEPLMHALGLSIEVAQADEPVQNGSLKKEAR